MTAQTVTEPANAIGRGKTVVVGDSYPVEDLHGKKMRVASKGTVNCKGKDCGEDCVGLALFVAAPEDYVETPTKDQPWRSGTVKICVTQLLDKKKQPLLDSIDVSAAKAERPKKKPGRPRKEKTENGEPVVKRRPGRPRKNPVPESVDNNTDETSDTAVAVAEPPRNGSSGAPINVNFEAIDVGPPTVAWDVLANAAESNDIATLALHARALKTRLEYLEPRYIVILEKLAALLSK